MLDLSASLVVITALLAYVNQRFVGLPPTIGVMSIALVLSCAFVGLDKLGIPTLSNFERQLVGSIDFSRMLLQGMLSFLLFAGALHVDLAKLRRYRWPIGILAVLGTTVSAGLIGAGSWFLLRWFGVNLPFAYCLIFGTLISPTDPIAVLSILKTAGAPQNVAVIITGESLFNDGVGVVLFALAFSLLSTSGAPDVSHTILLFLQQAGGGIALGLVLGFGTYSLLRSIDDYHVEVLLTIAAVMGGYTLAERLHVSGLLAIVVVGLVIGNQGRARAMSEDTRQRIDVFWELIDAILNAILFVLMGFEIILIKFPSAMIVPAIAILFLTLGARLITVAFPIALFRHSFGLPAGAWRILTWGGLRGGISVALALSLPHGAERNAVVSLTYVIVLFSILVQGLTIGALVKRMLVGAVPTRIAPADAR